MPSDLLRNRGINSVIAAQVATPTKPELRRIKLADLEPMPGQELYDDCGDAEDRALLEDIRNRGLDHPLEVLPPVDVNGREIYRLLDGNRRKRAQEILGHTETDVLVRHELAGADECELRVQFLSKNFSRRQLDTVQRVRVAVEIYRAKTARGRQLSQDHLQRARDQIGEQVGLSGRSVSRYLRLSQTPLPVQRAVSRGLLKLVVGEKVCDLKSDDQAELAKRIANITDAAEVQRIVGEYLHRRPQGRHVNTGDAINSFLTMLGRGLADVEDRVDQVGATVVIRHQETLHRAARVIEKLLAVATQNTKPSRPLSRCPKRVQSS